MRGLAAAALVVVAAAIPGHARAGTIDLRIAFRAQESSPPRILVLTCANGSARGTVRDPAGACRRLQRLGNGAFAPTKRGVACTEIFGGPSTAVVTGRFLGRPLWVRLRRDNGCEIDRWQRVAFLLPRPANPS
jgi:hypothetical protein